MQSMSGESFYCIWINKVKLTWLKWFTTNRNEMKIWACEFLLFFVCFSKKKTWSMYNANEFCFNSTFITYIQCEVFSVLKASALSCQSLSSSVTIWSRNSNLMYLFLRFSQKDCTDQRLHSYSVIFLKSYV